MSPKGRPTKGESARTQFVKIRVTEEEKALIQKTAEEMHLSQSDMILKAVEMLRDQMVEE